MASRVAASRRCNAGARRLGIAGERLLGIAGACGAALLAGCFIKPSAPAGSGSDAGSGSGDGGGTGDAPACASYSDWSGLHIVDSTKGSAYLETNPALSPDGKWLMFTRESSGGGPLTLWLASVDGTTVGTPMDSGLGSNADAVTWAPSGDEIYAELSSSRVIIPFDRATHTFGNPTPVTEFLALNAQRPEGRFTVTRDGHHIYYEVSVNNITRLFHASGTLGDTWTSTGEITQLDGEGDYQATPQISADGTEIFFATAHGSNAQLATAKRATPTDPFGPPTLLTFSEGERPTLSHAGTVMFFNGPDFDLYYVTRTCQ